jgi:serine phosphatase RsbU (regulator of sigma subunit)
VRPTDDASSVLVQLLQATHLIAPDELPAVVAEHATGLGAVDTVIYLVDYEQRLLVPMPTPKGAADREPVRIDATVAGRCFRTTEVQESTTELGAPRLWVPMLDGTERMGVLQLDYSGEDDADDVDAAGHAAIRAFASLTAELIVSKQAYGDAFEAARRRQPMTLAAELAWQLVPPRTFGTERLTISAVLAPCYEIGGDAFDYGVDEQLGQVAIFDAMGHGLEAGLLSTVAVAAYRNARRHGLDLEATFAFVDEAVHTQFGNERFVTAIFAELDSHTGAFRWMIGGHPPPLLIRGGKVVKTLDGNVGLPLGLGMPAPSAEEMLEPGDQVVLFTDGVIEARSSDGEFFGIDRLVHFISRASASGNPPAETMRQLQLAVLDHQAGDLQDDATILLVAWQESPIADR